jgi:hypothetical protein
MDPQLETQLKNLHTKLQLLLKQNQLLHRQVASLQKDNNNYKNSLEEKTASISKLQQQADIVNLSAGALDDKEKQHLRKRIDLYLAEIEKCLVLINE